MDISLTAAPKWHSRKPVRTEMSLRQDVMIAFSKVHHPGDDSLTVCPCDECQWEVARFKGKKWSRLSLADVSTESANIFLLTPAAFHYFLPGLLLLILDHPDADSLLGRIISRLVVSDQASEAERANVEQFVSRLSARQRQVLVEIVRQAHDSASYSPVVWNSAIANLRGDVVSPYSSEALEQWCISLRKDV